MSASRDTNTTLLEFFKALADANRLKLIGVLAHEPRSVEDLAAALGLDDRQRPGFERIDVRYRVDTDAPREQVEELCAYVQRTSPVLDVLTKPVPVTVALEG